MVNKKDTVKTVIRPFLAIYSLFQSFPVFTDLYSCLNNLKTCPTVASHVHPFIAITQQYIYKYFQSSAIPSNVQPFPTISRHFRPFSSHFQPFQAFSSYFQPILAISTHFQQCTVKFCCQILRLPIPVFIAFFNSGNMSRTR